MLGDLFDELGGRVLWEGASRIDGKPIVAIITGLKKPSANSKTGEMAQTWIIRSDIKPGEAARLGEDESVCGDCVHRVVGGKGTCYVNVGWGVNAVYQAYKRGKYPPVNTEARQAIRENFHVRFGAYGDPVAVPIKVWKALLPDRALDATGYTHAWRMSIARDYKEFLMASVDSPAERAEASDAGWRSFMVVPLNRDIPDDVTWCPSDSLNPRKNKIPCEKCGLCSGTRHEGKDVAIFVHGPSAKNFGTRKRKANLPILEKETVQYDPLVRVEPGLHKEMKAHVKSLGLGRTMKPWVAAAIREKMVRDIEGLALGTTMEHEL